MGFEYVAERFLVRRVRSNASDRVFEPAGSIRVDGDQCSSSERVIEMIRD